MTAYPGGLYHLDGNPGLSFYEIATALRDTLGRAWVVTAVEQPVFDNRMADDLLHITPITARLNR
jgi:hypothetical protein